MTTLFNCNFFNWQNFIFVLIIINKSNAELEVAQSQYFAPIAILEPQQPNYGLGVPHFVPTTNNPLYNPLLSALLFSAALGVPSRTPHVAAGYNHPEHLQVNPYVALLLSQYGRYINVPGAGKGLYGYGAVNNYHNNKPFGAYKIHEDTDG